MRTNEIIWKYEFDKRWGVPSETIDGLTNELNAVVKANEAEAIWNVVTELQANGLKDAAMLVIKMLSYEECIACMETNDFRKDELLPIVKVLFNKENTLVCPKCGSDGIIEYESNESENDDIETEIMYEFTCSNCLHNF